MQDIIAPGTRDQIQPQTPIQKIIAATAIDFILAISAKGEVVAIAKPDKVTARFR